MQFVIYCLDKPKSGEIRAANRAAHLDYLGGFAASALLAGPLLSPDGTGMVGSLLVMDFPDRKAADDFCAGDPYAKAGLFQSVTVSPFRKVLPK
jgi:uncharacterized protein